MATDEGHDGVRAAGGVVWRHRPGRRSAAPGGGGTGADPGVTDVAEVPDLPGAAATPELPSVEVVVVHRPAYDDWSFPKGKADGDESPEETAVREVEEETGLRCRLGPELPSTRYADRKGRDKVVRYWAMTVEEQHHRPPDDEVDEWRWVTPDEAEALLSYDRDRTVLKALRDVVYPV